jgi:hypothetical protein
MQYPNQYNRVPHDEYPGCWDVVVYFVVFIVASIFMCMILYGVRGY